MRYLLLIFLVACGDAGSDISAGGGYTGDGGDASDGGPAPGGGTAGGEAGLLTAGEFDDNLNFGAFQASLDEHFGAIVPQASIPTAGRMIVSIEDASGAPIGNARVELVGTGTSLIAGSDGRVLLLPGSDGSHALRVVAPNGASIETDAAATIVVPGAEHVEQTRLDLAFVVDATGSMGDEIAYLQAELAAIANRITSEHPGLSVRFGLVVYRDVGDEYVSRLFDFAPLAQFQARLDDQSANGGGDYPEAAEQGMRDGLSELTWRDGDVTRLLFHVADAPPHASGYGEFLELTATAREKGIRIFPVAASGVALEAEYLMRSQALATLGRYIFLTDDSGVGDSHEPPRIPCYHVEKLADLLARTLESELAGEYLPPNAEEIIRTVGTPVNGLCVDEPE